MTYVGETRYEDARQRFYAHARGIEVRTDAAGAFGTWRETGLVGWVFDESALVVELLRTRRYPATTEALLKSWAKVLELRQPAQTFDLSVFGVDVEAGVPCYHLDPRVPS